LLWPDGKRFAFSIFDDPDGQTLQGSKAVYSFLTDLGVRSTIGVWPIAASPELRSDPGMTCANPEYLQWILELQSRGFEIGFHNSTSHTCEREQTEIALKQFEKLFGAPPKTMSNHYHSRDALYWGEDRLSGAQRTLYNLATRGKNRRASFGHEPGHPMFWGDLAREKIRYCRNFVFGDINTLKECPEMPYHDPDRAFVNYWYASSGGANLRSCVSRISEPDQDRLEEQGGACILYVHFGHGFQENGQVHPRFQQLMRRIAAKQGWFVPVADLLDLLLEHRKDPVIQPKQRSAMERRWLWHKLRQGSE
jgi:hypothetical protein